MHVPTGPVEFREKAGISCGSTGDTTSLTVLEIMFQIQTKPTI